MSQESQPKITLEYLQQQNLLIFKLKKKIERMSAQVDIENGNLKYMIAEYHDKAMDFKVQEGLPLDQEFHLKTGKPITEGQQK